MVKDGSRRKYVCEELVVAVDGDTDALACLCTVRIHNYKLGRVGTLTADERTADVSCSCIEEHSLRQRREAGIRAYGIGVRWGTTASNDGAARISRALRSAWARGRRDRQRTTGCGYVDLCCGGGRTRGIGRSQRVGSRRRWVHARRAARERGSECPRGDGNTRRPRYCPT